MCDGVEVVSLGQSSKVVRNGQVIAKPQEISAVAVPADNGEVSGRIVAITVLGPVLGAMDAANIKTGLACMAKGFEVTSYVTRSANYHGAVLANVTWRPELTLRVVVHKPEVVFQSTWRMRLTDGVELGNARTPPYADQKYPMTGSTVLSVHPR